MPVMLPTKPPPPPITNFLFHCSGSNNSKLISVPITPRTRQCGTVTGPSDCIAVASVIATSGSLSALSAEQSAPEAEFAPRRLTITSARAVDFVGRAFFIVDSPYERWGMIRRNRNLLPGTKPRGEQSAPRPQYSQRPQEVQ